MKGYYWNPVCTKLLRIITQAYQPHSQRAGRLSKTAIINSPGYHRHHSLHLLLQASPQANWGSLEAAVVYLCKTYLPRSDRPTGDSNRNCDQIPAIALDRGFFTDASNVTALMRSLAFPPL